MKYIEFRFNFCGHVEMRIVLGKPENKAVLENDFRYKIPEPINTEFHRNYYVYTNPEEYFEKHNFQFSDFAKEELERGNFVDISTYMQWWLIERWAKNDEKLLLS